jgi:hypothetical protein
MGFYLTTLTGIGIVSKALWRSYNIKKACTAIKAGVQEDIDVYLHRSGFTEEKHVLRVMQSRHRFVTTALAKWAAIGGLFAVMVQLKNKNRSNK